MGHRFQQRIAESFDGGWKDEKLAFPVKRVELCGINMPDKPNRIAQPKVAHEISEGIAVMTVYLAPDDCQRQVLSAVAQDGKRAQKRVIVLLNINIRHRQQVRTRHLIAFARCHHRGGTVIDDADFPVSHAFHAECQQTGRVI